MPGSFLGGNTFVICRPLPLAQGASSATGGAPSCLHLNGENLTVTNGTAIFGSTGIMNIMGDGVVSGNRTGGNGSDAATILLNSSKATGTINLYGEHSTSVFSIMKDTNSAADNAAHGEMDIYANAYIVVDGEKIYVADWTFENIRLVQNG